jgi:hypothetical protein
MLVTGIAWYRREQWPQLRAAAVDENELEKTYDEWLAVANRTLRDLKAHGIFARKVDVDVNELLAWCRRHTKFVDGNARSEFVADKLKHPPAPAEAK